jgi:hypothetical protein
MIKADYHALEESWIKLARATKMPSSSTMSSTKKTAEAA